MKIGYWQVVLQISEEIINLTNGAGQLLNFEQ